MKNFFYMIWLLSLFGCSKVPNKVPIDSVRPVTFNIDMNQIIQSGEFNSESDILY